MKKQKLGNKIGRPEKVTGEILRKLETSFAIGANVTEACSFADLPSSTFYDFLKKNEWFSERIDSLKAKPILKAKQAVFNNLDDPNFALRYLERVSNDEFSIHQRKTVNDKSIQRVIVRIPHDGRS